MRGEDRLLFMGFVFAYMFMFPFAADAERTFPPLTPPLLSGEAGE